MYSRSLVADRKLYAYKSTSRTERLRDYCKHTYKDITDYRHLYTVSRYYLYPSPVCWRRQRRNADAKWWTFLPCAILPQMASCDCSIFTKMKLPNIKKRRKIKFEKPLKRVFFEVKEKVTNVFNTNGGVASNRVASQNGFGDPDSN